MLDDDEQAAIRAGIAPRDALGELKTVLADQYAVATDNNRIINLRRVEYRSRAGVATMAAILAMIVLVAVVVLGYKPSGS